jgi:hypothetical protein
MHPEICLLLELHDHGHVGMGGLSPGYPLVEQGEPLDLAPSTDLLGLDVPRPAFGAHRPRGVDPVAAVETSVDEEPTSEEALELTLVIVIEGHTSIALDQLGIAHVHVGSLSLSVRRTVRLEFM